MNAGSTTRTTKITVHQYTRQCTPNTAAHSEQVTIIMHNLLASFMHIIFMLTLAQ